MPKRKILIVDRDAQSAALLQEDLADDGYLTDMVTSGFEALSSTDSNIFNLAIIDRNLADIDSLRLCEKIRDRYDAKQLPIIVISSFDDDEDRNRALSLGANNYLCKPFVYDSLAQIVTKLVADN